MLRDQPQSWRDVLRTILEDSDERQRLENEFDPRSLHRWAFENVIPQTAKLKRLFDTLPQYRWQLLSLLREEDPEMAKRIEPLEVQDTMPSLPITVYASVMEERTKSTSPLSLLGIGMHVLQSLVEHLSTEEIGIAAVCAQCIAPSEPHMEVRALREHFSHTNSFWPTPFTTDMSPYFLGAESVAGAVVLSGRPMTFHDTKQEHFLRFHPLETVLRHTNSLVAYPVVQGERVAGALLILSTHPRFFSPLRLEVVKRYSELLALAFREHEFFDRSSINLGMLPEASVQLLYLASFQRKVTEMHIRAEHTGNPVSYQEAQSQVLAQFLLDEGFSDGT